MPVSGTAVDYAKTDQAWFRGHPRAVKRIPQTPRAWLTLAGRQARPTGRAFPRDRG